jgi:hypothetical protein
MMYAPEEVNWRRMSAIEDKLRQMRDVAQQSGSSIELTAVANSHPPGTPPRGYLLLHRVQYEFTLRQANGAGRQFLGRYSITVDPPPYRPGSAQLSPDWNF